MRQEIMVSITCLTYNHENYIADAIEGFLMQKTNFAYEILIHEDASTDRTPEIIKEYESQYPDLIKPIYQKENQFSKNVKVGRFNSERVKGKYIATCEGDDFWTDPYKLQKQVDYMEQHPECSLCIHASFRVRMDKTKLRFHVRPNRGNKLISVEEIIGQRGIFATNSMFYPAVFRNNRPDFYNNAPVDDYPLAIYLALQGTVYYMDEFMSAYRVGVTGSWTDMILTSMERRITHQERIIEMLIEINKYTEYKYDLAIKKELQSIKNKLFIERYLPGIAKALIKLKRNYNEQ